MFRLCPPCPTSPNCGGGQRAGEGGTLIVQNGSALAAFTHPTDSYLVS
jgi:hypothetical protein